MRFFKITFFCFLFCTGFSAFSHNPEDFVIASKKINGQVNYPREAMENNISGTVLVSFFIDLDGKAVDYKIEEGIGGGCDEEAIRVAKLIPNNWIPGLLDSKPVKVKYTLPINFSLSYN